MYDTIMYLPLFKGVTADDVSSFLERTKLDLRNYEDGNEIIPFDSVVERLGFVISGRVKVSTELAEGRVVVKQILGKGFWLLPEVLFGLVRESRSSIVSDGKTCVLWLTKEHVFELIAENYLCRVNYLNYLCYRAQCRHQCAEYMMSGTELERWLAVVLATTTERRAAAIKISVAFNVLASILGVDEETLKIQMQRFSRKRKVTYINGSLNIHNRKDYF